MSQVEIDLTNIELRQIPRELAELHADLDPGTAARLRICRFGEDTVPVTPEDLVLGAGFSDATFVRGGDCIVVTCTRARTLPDHVAPDLRLLVCGLNPSLHAADAGVGYSRPGNRFWPAAIEAGLVDRDRDRRHALDRGLGLTDLVKRATSRGHVLTEAEYSSGLARVERLVRWLRPARLCFVGLSGWRNAVDARARAGPVAGGFAGTPAYLMPSTSGANAHATVDELTDYLRRAASPEHNTCENGSGVSRRIRR